MKVKIYSTRFENVRLTPFYFVVIRLFRDPTQDLLDSLNEIGVTVFSADDPFLLKVRFKFPVEESCAINSIAECLKSHNLESMIL